MPRPPRRTALPLFALLGTLLTAHAPDAPASPSRVRTAIGPNGATARERLPGTAGVVRLATPGRVSSTAIDPAEPLRVIVEFDTPPGVVRRLAGLAAAPAEDRLSRLGADLATLAGVATRARAARGAANPEAFAHITSSWTQVMSGAAVTLSPSLLDPVRALPYVRRVVLDDTVRASLAESVPIIRADELQATTGATGEGVRVGIVDTGIDYSHPALGGGFGPGHRVAGGWDFVNADADPLDDHGHGTHVAGIVGGDGGGVTGVAPGVTLYAFKVLAAEGYGWTSWILDGFDRCLDPDQDPATDDAMDVINVSLGAPGGDPDDVLALALDRLTDAGVVCCVAAGNEGMYWSIGTPGTSRKAITVGSTDKSDSLSWFTSLGPVPRTYDLKPDLLAPGEAIVSAALGGGTVGMSGTSMATPHVAGSAALLLELHPSWTPQDVKSALAATSVDLARSPFQQGSGRIDLVRADATQLTFSPIHLTFGRAPLSGPAWHAVDTLTVHNLDAGAHTITFPASLEIAPGAVAHVSPPSVVVPGDDSARVIVVLDVDPAVLPTPATVPNGYSATLVGTCGDLDYRVPVSFHRFASLQVSSAAPVQMLIVEDHATRALVFADFLPPEVRLPPGQYDVTLSFYPFYTFVTRSAVTVGEHTVLDVDPAEAAHVLTFADVDADGTPVTCNAGSFQVQRAGSSWSLGWVGFPVDEVRTNELDDGWSLQWSRVKTDWLTEWRSYPGQQSGAHASRLYSNTAAGLHRFTMHVPVPAGTSVAPLFYDYHPNPPGWGGYFGIGSYAGIPATASFDVTYETRAPSIADHYALGTGLELWPLIAGGTDIDWMTPPQVITPCLRTDRGWPLETHLAVMLFEPASRFGGHRMDLFGGLPVWRGMFHDSPLEIALDEGGLFFAPHVWSDGYGTALTEPDADFELHQNGMLVASGPMTGTGGFAGSGWWSIGVAAPGPWDFATSRRFPFGADSGTFRMLARIDTANPVDADPPSLRAFQVRANGQEAQSIDFSASTGAEVRFRASDAGAYLAELRVQADGMPGWTTVPLALDAGEWHGALPPSLSGDVTLELVLTDAQGQSASHTWTPAFHATPGPVTAVPPPVAARAGLALAGAWPNPARSDHTTMRCSLAGGIPARLELLDVAGRSVAAVTLEAPREGEQFVTMAPRSPLLPGVYFARLTQGGEHRSARVCVVR